MRYISKTTPPEFFAESVRNYDSDTKWKALRNQKPRLKRHILENEQKYLCAYCEIRTDMDNSHIEHIKPQSDPKNRFDYDNLIVSCNGKQCVLSNDSEDYEEDIHSCGHKKDDVFDETLFISPVKEQNAADFFHFDKEDGKILPNSEFSEQHQNRASYTIILLNLDNDRLNKYRLDARKALEKEAGKLLKLQGAEFTKQKIKSVLSSDDSVPRLEPFITFLRFCFKSILK